MCLDARLRIRTEFKYRKYRVMWPFFFLRLIFIKEKRIHYVWSYAIDLSELA